MVQVNRGAIAEQFVAQELLAYIDPQKESQLFFWQKDKKTSSAEIDFLYVYDHLILPVEVKAGPYGKLRSMLQFMKEKKSKLGIQISQKPLSYEKEILSVPFYLISQLSSLINQVV